MVPAPSPTVLVAAVSRQLCPRSVTNTPAAAAAAGVYLIQRRTCIALPAVCDDYRGSCCSSAAQVEEVAELRHSTEFFESP